MASEICPECGYPLHRSHSRGFNEKLIRSLTKAKIYRCHECEWRGWVSKGAPRKVSPLLQRLVPIGLTLLVTLLISLLAIYFAGQS
ncbi:MAG: hypothetical protein AB1757_20370 [Acidobacteriota bacterium]